MGSLSPDFSHQPSCGIHTVPPRTPFSLSCGHHGHRTIAVFQADVSRNLLLLENSSSLFILNSTLYIKVTSSAVALLEVRRGVVYAYEIQCVLVSAVNTVLITHVLETKHVCRSLPIYRDIGICSLYVVLIKGQDTNLELPSCSSDVAPFLHRPLNNHVEPHISSKYILKHGMNTYSYKIKKNVISSASHGSEVMGYRVSDNLWAGQHDGLLRP